MKPAPDRLSSRLPPDRGRLVIADLAGIVKEAISRHGAESVEQAVIRICQTLRLSDQHGSWTGPPNALIPNLLFDGLLSAAHIHQFIDDVVFANEQNPYLMDFFDSLHRQDAESFIGELHPSAVSLIPEITAFALVLQSLSAAFYPDIGLVKQVVTHWEQEAAMIGLHKKLGPGFRIKFESIRLPIRRSRECVLAGKVPARFCNFILPINILQASAYDLARGRFGNARTGWVLARHRPGNKPDPASGAGPVHFVENGRIIESGLPLARRWADLYQTWNLAFGAQFDTFPFYLCKLIIPQVAGYQSRPQQYIWNRTHALMSYLYYAAFATYDQEQGQAGGSLFHTSAWSGFAGAGLHRRWGDMNYVCARDYANRVKDARLDPNVKEFP